MITENYISFETAKLLKEKGFEELVTHYYFTQITHVGFKDYPTGVLYTDSYPENQNNYNNKVAAPTLQMAMKWLREIHNIHVVPKFDFYAGDYTGRIYDGRRESTVEKDDYIAIVGNSTYEKACEAAIKYCLEKLI